MSRTNRTRRRLLTTGLIGLSSLAGCTGSLTSDDGPAESSTVPEAEQWPRWFFDAANSNRRPTDVGPGGASSVSWHRPTLPEFPFHPVIRGEFLYATGNDSDTLFALDARSGEEQWTRSFVEGPVAVSVHDGTLYALSSDSLQALDPMDGGQRWRQSFDFERPGITTPADDRLYFWGVRPGFDENVVVSVIADSGAEDWRFRTDWTVSGFAIGPERLYATAHEPNGLVAIDRENGEAVWRTRLDTGSQQVYIPTFDDDRLYVGGLGFQYLYAFEADTGDELWRSDIPTATGASLTDDGLIAGGAGTVTAVDRDDGSHDWQRELEGTLTFRPTVTPSTVFVAQFITENDALGGSPIHALNPGTGETRWQVQTDGRIWTAPAVTEDGLFGTFQDGSVFRIAES